MTNIFKHSKALTNKLYLSTRSEHNVGRHTFGHHHHLSRHIPHSDVHWVCPYKTILILDITHPQRILVLETTLILDTLSSKSIGPWDYSYLGYISSRSINPRVLSNLPFSLPMPSLGLWLLVLTIVHDTWRIQCPSSLPLNQGGNPPSQTGRNHKPKLVSKVLIKASTTCSFVEICLSYLAPICITS